MAGVVEPAAAGTTVAVLSGGNIDLALVAALATRQETAAGRRVRLFTRVSDKPGGLAELLSTIAGNKANLIQIEHVRDGIDLAVGETGVELTLETDGADHAEALVSLLDGEGYSVRVVSEAEPPPRSAATAPRTARPARADRAPRSPPPGTRSAAPATPVSRRWAHSCTSARRSGSTWPAPSGGRLYLGRGRVQGHARLVAVLHPRQVLADVRGGVQPVGQLARLEPAAAGGELRDPVDAERAPVPRSQSHATRYQRRPRLTRLSGSTWRRVSAAVARRVGEAQPLAVAARAAMAVRASGSTWVPPALRQRGGGDRARSPAGAGAAAAPARA